MSKANPTRAEKRNTATTAQADSTMAELLLKLGKSASNTMGVLDERLKAAEAICDAAAVLCALERAPVHHDTHPGHNIVTGGGVAHGERTAHDTLPILLRHARTLIEMSLDEAGCFCEEVEGGAA